MTKISKNVLKRRKSPKTTQKRPKTTKKVKKRPKNVQKRQKTTKTLQKRPKNDQYPTLPKTFPTLHVGSARSEEEKGRFYTPLGKLSRFNQKLSNFGKPLNVIERADSYFTLTGSDEWTTVEVDNPMARKIVIDKNNGFYKRAVEGFKYWPREPYPVKANVTKKTCDNFEFNRLK